MNQGEVREQFRSEGAMKKRGRGGGGEIGVEEEEALKGSALSRSMQMQLHRVHRDGVSPRVSKY